MIRRSRYGYVARLLPEAAARCDRGGEIRKRSELIPEMRWVGARLVPTGFLCCARHIDPPQPQDRLIVLQADPLPIDQPRIDIDALQPAAQVQPVLLDENGLLLLDEYGGVLFLDL